jgi:hypothetical protein
MITPVCNKCGTQSEFIEYPSFSYYYCKPCKVEVTLEAKSSGVNERPFPDFHTDEELELMRAFEEFTESGDCIAKKPAKDDLGGKAVPPPADKDSMGFTDPTGMRWAQRIRMNSTFYDIQYSNRCGCYRILYNANETTATGRHLGKILKCKEHK